jgi:integrase
MIKRRLRDVGLPSQLSPHSFRVATATDLLLNGIPLEDVQYLLGHADPRNNAALLPKAEEGHQEYGGEDFDLSGKPSRRPITEPALTQH